MLSKLLLVSTIILNSCTNQKMHLAEHQTEYVSIKYQAFSRGFFQEIMVKKYKFRMLLKKGKSGFKTPL